MLPITIQKGVYVEVDEVALLDILNLIGQFFPFSDHCRISPPGDPYPIPG